MGQVPLNAPRSRNSPFYLLIGNGRVSRHFQFYFKTLSLPYRVWRRGENLALSLEGVSHVLLLIQDPEIERFYLKNRSLLHVKTCVHFSGALVSDCVPSAHPLMTFADDLYPPETYPKIPFVLEAGRGLLKDLLPGLANPSVPLPSEKKPLYHALCVMSGNFTTLLWEKTFNEFNRTLDLPRGILLPYLSQTLANLTNTDRSVLTGPLARGDNATIAKHLEILEDDPYQNVYRAFVEAHIGGQT